MSKQTPLVDSHLVRPWGTDEGPFVDPDFARELELERDELRAALTVLLESHDNLYRAVFGEHSEPTADMAAKPARALLARIKP